MEGLLTAATAGLSAGGAYAVLGVCSVFTYRLVAVVNFAGAAIGAVGAFTLVTLFEGGMALLPALLIGLAAGVAAATALGLVMTRWFSGSPPAVKAAVTAAILVGVIAVGLRLTGGQDARLFPDILPGSAFRLAGVQITWAAIATVLLAIVFTLAAETFLARTRAGLKLRALSERPLAAELLGMPVRRLALAVWMVTGAMTTLALMIIAPQRAPDFASMSLLIVPALAAALIGAFASFRAALVGGLTIGIVEGLASGIERFGQYRGALPFIVILAVLLWSQRRARWDEAR